MTEATAGFEAPTEPTEPAREQPETTLIAAVNQPPTAGSLLARAREAAGLTRADVAGKLKFSVKQIESVETDNFLALGNKTFVRGLVRTYAKLLELDSAPVLAALDSSALPPETGQVEADPKGVPFPTAAQPGNPLVRYAGLSMLVIALAIILLYLWHGEEFLSGPGISAPAVKPQTARPAPAPPSTSVNLTPTVVDMPPPMSTTPATTTAPTTRVTPPATPATDKPADKTTDKVTDRAADKAPAMAADKAMDKAPAKSGDKTVDNAAAQTATAATTANAARGAGRRILMSFERNSWVEVKDASGRVVFSQLNLAGTQQVIEGRAPFELVIGNAGYVNLRYRDTVVDLKPYTKSEVARLNLN
jgi:cytoskeleton protein RodZ